MDDLRDCSSFGWIVVCFISLATNALFTVLGIVAIVKVRQGQNTKRKDTHTKVRSAQTDVCSPINNIPVILGRIVLHGTKQAREPAEIRQSTDSIPLVRFEHQRPRRIDYKELYELPPPPIPPRNY